MGSFLEQIGRDLNPEQLAAVQHDKGPLLILAGAGSGKTRVLTSRIAFLVKDCGVPLNCILAMTFSNKAAREMHERVKTLLQDDSPYRYQWISTFHSVGVRLLRRFGERIGIPTDFSIYDTDDQINVVKRVCEDLDFSEKSLTPKALHARISRWKNEPKFPQELTHSTGSSFDDAAKRVYVAYQNELRKSKALDFDDLLLESFRLVSSDAEVRELLQKDWQYILVDEFQDTNDIQYRFLQLIVNENKNICVVGDDDQSIYGWRGAKVENILNFNHLFQPCRVIKLERNYRSTANILKAATSVISKNDLRHEKTLWTEKSGGAKIRMAVLQDDRREATFVVDEIQKQLRAGVPASEIAVMYRVNAISRVFEEECLRKRLPYKIIGGFRFYERREIKDILAYLKFIMNPSDTIAFRRTINTPSRGIGKVSIEKIEEAAAAYDQSMGDFVGDPSQEILSGKARLGFQQYREFYMWGRAALDTEMSLADLLCGAIENTGYLAALQADPSEEAREREANLQELLTAIQEFEEQWTPPDGEQGLSWTKRKMFDFLERVSLIADVDQLDEREENQVTFMSLHAAKGLEFKTCFVAAMEDGLFPSIRSFDSPDDLEEERRLCYVGITRAKELLYLTRAEYRRTFGSINFQISSRFFKDIPPDVLEPYYDEAYRSPSEASSFSFRRKAPSYNEFNQEPDFDADFNQEVSASAYARGERVTHPSFGKGVVRKIEKLGSDECLTIDFEQRGRKRVLSQFVQKSA